MPGKYQIRKQLASELDALLPETTQDALMKRALARMARRHGRWRRQMGNRHQRSGETSPWCPEAA